MKLWSKGTTQTAGAIERFTVGQDREMDQLLAPYDILGSLAHCKMLAAVKLLTQTECDQLVNELRALYNQSITQGISIPPQAEDIHSYIEALLTEKLGDTGKKIHAARSRNDQVLVDIKLYLRHEIESLVDAVQPFFSLLIQQSERFKHHLLPGYTHLQLAMPSSFGLWMGAYAESMVDDVITLQSAYRVVNKNPLGSAAGYGSSFPINRTLTTELLGFEALNYNVVYAQMGRGKAERITAAAMANLADTLAKMSMDACLYLNQHFNFISFPAEFTTGSSIMPHKKNPDVFELIRAKCNQLRALPNEILMVTTNLPSGYHRDLQILKEHMFPAFQTLKDCLEMMHLMISQITVRENILTDEKFAYLFSVEEVNKLVLQGVPFRDAYVQVGKSIEAGTFSYQTELHHTHEGSIGNLCNPQITSLMQEAVSGFQFTRVQQAIASLLAD
ncbi:MAG: argininosuccinate lyase [Bacteroidetes bacterium]|nr:argininosuccinate lyase [Bacteroidota bacterium]